MRILLDTNIIIHREATKVINDDIGVLFRWLDELKHDKIIHPVTVSEIGNYQTAGLSDSFKKKLLSYSVLKTIAPLTPEMQTICNPLDNNQNDRNDTILLNEVFSGRVDLLISEDKKIHKKAALLGIEDKVLFIDTFIERCLIENPSLVDYKIQTVKKEYFGNINLKDSFFDSFRNDYYEFDKWFVRKSDESAYVCYDHGQLCAFLYLKIEDRYENYSDISPVFSPKKRLKIGTLKVTLNGYKIGERFIKIIIDNALRFRVDEIYVTIFENTLEQKRLVRLLEQYGFSKHGTKHSTSGDEIVYVKSMTPQVDLSNLKASYPYVDANRQAFLVPIYPQYHTALLPDSILANETPQEYEYQESYRNAISKVYICRSFERDIHPGDIIVFYRTGGYYKSVITTIGVVENTVMTIKNSDDFIQLCRQRSVFTKKELLEQWNYNPNNRPFIVNFLYTYSFPHRINMQRLIELKIIADVNSAPRGFYKISHAQFLRIVKETGTNENIIVG